MIVDEKTIFGRWETNPHLSHSVRGGLPTKLEVLQKFQVTSFPNRLHYTTPHSPPHL